jgi:hypothetical protein
VLTDHRAISVTSGRHWKVHAEFLRNVPALNKKVRADGSGSVAFGNVPSWSIVPGGFAFGFGAMYGMQFVLLFLGDPRRRSGVRAHGSVQARTAAGALARFNACGQIDAVVSVFEPNARAAWWG